MSILTTPITRERDYLQRFRLTDGGQAPNQERFLVLSDYNAGHYVGALAEHLANATPEFTPSWRSKYGRQFKTAIEKDKATHEALMKAVRRIAEAWGPGKQLSVMQALSDVSASVASPRRRAEDRTRDYEFLFELSERQEKLADDLQKHGKEEMLRRMRA